MALVKAFAGMKSTSMDDYVETFPVGSAGLAIGVICGTDANGKIVAGPGTQVRGVSLHTHTKPTTGYVQYDAAPVVTRGRVYARVASGATVTLNGAVKYDASGLVNDAAANTMPNAKVRGTKFTADGVEIVEIELHSPQV